MRLEWLRPKSEVKDVLMEPRSSGPEITYWIFSDVSPKGAKEKWSNMTVISPGLYGSEFPKTFGHYHPAKTYETTKLLSGEGIYMLQTKFYENGKWIPDKVEAVYMVKLALGEQIVMNTHEMAHSWSNVGDTPLVALDDWDHGHEPTDYQEIKRLHGMCFYVVNDGGIKFVPNPNYKNRPEPKVITLREYQKIFS